MRILSRDFYQQGTKVVARQLLGKWLVHQLPGGNRLVAEICETEAYLGVNDPACHSYGNKRTERTQVMYGPAGYAYVYLIYGIYELLNVVTVGEGVPCAVLIRAVNPLDGVDEMAQRRFGVGYSTLRPAQKRALCDGPGKLTRAMAITRQHNGADLCKGSLLICAPPAVRPFFVKEGPRIGVDYAGEAAGWPLRYQLSRE